MNASNETGESDRPASPPGRAEVLRRPVVVFDCDGVIVDSNEIKTEGFARAVEGYGPEAVDAFVAYHRAHGGLSRYRKFEHFFRTVVGIARYEDEMDRALVAFEAAVVSAMLDCPLVPGVLDLLRELSGERVPCFVVSGSDQAELRGILARRGLDVFFRGIFGSPASKAERVGVVLRSLAMSGEGGILFGDALIDMETAVEFGMTPVFVSGFTLWAEGAEFCRVQGWPQIRDFTELQ